MKTKILLFASVLFAVVGCYKTHFMKEDPSPYPTTNEDVILTASTGASDAQSKVGFEDQSTSGVKVTWATKDMITLYDANGKWIADFELNSGAGNVKGTFKMIPGGTAPITGISYTAVYPRTSAKLLGEYNRLLTTQSQDFSAATPINHMSDKCVMMHSGYVYNASIASPITFTHKYAIMTLKLGTPASYVPMTDGVPTSVTLYSGNRIYNVVLKNVPSWTSPMTVYVMIDPALATTRTIRTEITTDKKQVFTTSFTSSKQYKAGARYTADRTGVNAPVRAVIYTLANLLSLPNNATEVIISDNIIASTDLTLLRTALLGLSLSSSVSVTLLNATGIEANAFKGVKKMVSVNLPLLTSAGKSAFESCENLVRINVPSLQSVSEGAFRGCEEFVGLALPSAKTIGISAFEGCKALVGATWPEVTSIGQDAFKGCTSLASVITQKATSVGPAAFSGCTKLATIQLPNVSTIGNYAFAGCGTDASVTEGVARVVLNTTGSGAITLGTSIFGVSGNSSYPLAATAKYDLRLGDNVPGVNGTVWTASGTAYIFNSIVGGKN